ncbi:hypothetical protein [Fodinibius roseus]|nr:hypothetical protein [Fodinibius roseus]
MNNKSEATANDVAHRNWWQTFEIVFGIPFLAAIVLEFVVPLSLPSEFLSPALIPGGIALTIFGMTLILHLILRKYAKLSAFELIRNGIKKNY